LVFALGLLCGHPLILEVAAPRHFYPGSNGGTPANLEFYQPWCAVANQAFEESAKQSLWLRMPSFPGKSCTTRVREASARQFLHKRNSSEYTDQATNSSITH
jgi:hypothetical protein